MAINCFLQKPVVTAPSLMHGWDLEAGELFDTFGSRAVVEATRLQELLKLICENSFEHHAVMNASHTAKILNEAFTTYFGWDTYMHSAS